MYFQTQVIQNIRNFTSLWGDDSMAEYLPPYMWQATQQVIQRQPQQQQVIPTDLVQEQINLENSSLPTITRQENKPKQKNSDLIIPEVPNNGIYNAETKTTTEFIPKGKQLNTYKNLITSGLDPKIAAKKFFNQYGQNVVSATPEGKIVIQDLFKSYPSIDAFAEDKVKLLKNYGLGNKPVSTEEFGKQLEKRYATQTDKSGNKIYAKQIVGTEKRASATIDVIINPNLSQEEKMNALVGKNGVLTVGNSFHGSIKTKNGKLDSDKLKLLVENAPIAWEAAQKMSSLLNDTVSPKTLFAQMANETAYFTKPVANYNLSSIKITNADREKLQSANILKSIGLLPE